MRLYVYQVISPGGHFAPFNDVVLGEGYADAEERAIETVDGIDNEEMKSGSIGAGLVRIVMVGLIATDPESLAYEIQSALKS